MAIRVEYLNPAAVGEGAYRGGLGDFRKWQAEMALREQQLMQQGQIAQAQLQQRENLAMFDRQAGLERMGMAAEIQRHRDQDFQKFRQGMADQDFDRQQLGAEMNFGRQMDLQAERMRMQEEMAAAAEARKQDQAAFGNLLKRQDLPPHVRKEALSLQRDIMGLRNAMSNGDIGQEEFGVVDEQLRGQMVDLLSEVGPPPTLEDDFAQNVLERPDGKFMKDKDGIWQRVRGDKTSPLEMQFEQEKQRIDAELKAAKEQQSQLKARASLVQQFMKTVKTKGADKDADVYWSRQEAESMVDELLSLPGQDQQQSPTASQQAEQIEIMVWNEQGEPVRPANDKEREAFSKIKYGPDGRTPVISSDPQRGRLEMSLLPPGTQFIAPDGKLYEKE